LVEFGGEGVRQNQILIDVIYYISNCQVNGCSKAKADPHNPHRSPAAAVDAAMNHFLIRRAHAIEPSARD